MEETPKVTDTRLHGIDLFPCSVPLCLNGGFLPIILHNTSRVLWRAGAICWSWNAAEIDKKKVFWFWPSQWISFSKLFSKCTVAWNLTTWSMSMNVAFFWVSLRSNFPEPSAGTIFWDVAFELFPEGKKKMSSFWIVNCSVSATLPTGQLSNVPWRRTGVKYTNNEAYFDVIEEIDAIIDKAGSTVTAEIQGYVSTYVKHLTTFLRSCGSHFCHAPTLTRVMFLWESIQGTKNVLNNLGKKKK